MPAFTIVPLLGKSSLDSVGADLMLITMVQGMRVPSKLYAMDARVGGTIKDKIKSAHFGGRRGQSLLFDVPLTDGDAKRKVLLHGIGRSEEYCGEVACEVFGKLIDEALEAGSSTVVVPLLAGGAAGGCVNIRSTVIKLRRMLAHKLASCDAGKAATIKEIKLFCTPQAKRHVQDGLDHILPAKHSEGCNCGD